MKRAAAPTTGIQRVMQGKLDLMWSSERPNRVNWKMKDKKTVPRGRRKAI